jgi:hypothetical protein
MTIFGEKITWKEILGALGFAIAIYFGTLFFGLINF